MQIATDPREREAVGQNILKNHVELKAANPAGTDLSKKQGPQLSYPEPHSGVTTDFVGRSTLLTQLKLDPPYPVSKLTNSACRKTPPLVHSANLISVTAAGFTQT